MINMHYDEIIEKIQQNSSLLKETIEERINHKISMLSGLVSKEGAAYIVANELGIKLVDISAKSLKINNISEGLRNMILVGKVLKIFDLKEFNRSGGGVGRLRSIILGDETGTIRIVFWNDKCDLLNDVSEGDIVELSGFNSRKNNMSLEIHSSNESSVKVNPNGVKIESVKSSVNSFSQVPKNTYTRYFLNDINENLINTYVKVSGVIVNVFNPSFFKLCPHCRQRVSEKSGNYYCDEHNLVSPVDSYVASVLVDDGTSVMRVALWKSQIDKIGLENINELIGKQKLIGGKVNKNLQTDRVEMSASFMVDPNPSEEIEFFESIC